jgi:hypothetical protein
MINSHALDMASKIQNLNILAVGHVTHDRYGDELVAGGCAYFGAKVASSLGAHVHLLTAVGDDFQLDSSLKGLAVDLKRGGQTTVFTNLYPENAPRLQIVETQAPMINLDQAVHAGLQNQFFDVLFLAPVMGELDLREPWASQLHARYRTMTLQGLMKCGQESQDAVLKSQGKRIVVKVPTRLDFSILKGLDAVFLSDEDLLLFGDDQFLADLIAVVPLVYVTQGEKGCLIYQNGQTINQPLIYRTENVVDTTGAGDTFAMATSLALACGLSVQDAAVLGACASSVMIEGIGSLPMNRLKEAFERFKFLIDLT